MGGEYLNNEKVMQIMQSLFYGENETMANSQKVQLKTMQDILTLYPEAFDAEGNINLSNRPEIIELPLNMEVVRDLNIDGCTGLRALPEGLVVGQRLNARGCTSLKSLPNNFELPGTLILSGCTGITELPVGLDVEGGIYLDGCISLRSIPNDTRFGEILELTGCEGIEIPQDLLQKYAGFIIVPEGEYTVAPSEHPEREFSA